MIEHETLALIFAALMALSLLVYAMLDGYDLGVGMLLPFVGDQVEKRDIMIASIGPFWDANETWLVLSAGLMLIAFPAAHNVVLFHLYVPTSLMLLGLILRGVAFDFRAKAALGGKPQWDRLFFAGSLLASLSQGYMLGQYIMSFEQSGFAIVFSLMSALGVTAGYIFIGACWLVMKTEGELQRRATRWARFGCLLTGAGVISVCSVNLVINPQVFANWFQFPLVMFVLLIPISCVVLFVATYVILEKLPVKNDRYCWLPFVNALLIFLLCFTGLAFGFYPWIVPGQLTIYSAASAPESLSFILFGAVGVLPMIIAYTVFSYRVFRGKASQLRYH